MAAQSSSSAKKSIISSPPPPPAQQQAHGTELLERTYRRAEDNRPRNQLWPKDFIPGPSIGECLDGYHAEHAHRRKAQRYYVTEALNQFLAANALDEGMPIRLLQKGHCKAYKAALLDGSYKRTRKPGPVTIARKLSTLHHFVTWCVANDHMETDIMSGLALPAKLVSSSRVLKEGFTDEELSRIFARLATKKEKAPEFYWIVVLLAHSGCRATEVLQLLRSDIQQEDGWFMNISGKEEGQQLKNRASIRQVPIHSHVLKAGFLDYYQAQTDKRLFPLSFPYGSVKLSLDFTRLLKQLKVKRPAVTLHSLRHTMTIKLERARVHYSLMRRMLGHAVGKAVEDRVYLGSLKYSVKEMSEALESVSFP